MSSVVEMRVHMDCAGCESKVKSALEKTKEKSIPTKPTIKFELPYTLHAHHLGGTVTLEAGHIRASVDTVEIDLTQQKVTVTGWADQKKILKKVRRTGCRAELWQLPYTTEGNGLYNQHHLNGPANYYASQPSSHYNYYKHGAGSSNGRYYNTGSTSSFGNQTSSAFSDDNPHACHIM